MNRLRSGRPTRLGRRRARKRRADVWRVTPIAGFTLLELTIVTVIIGILASMAAPNVQRVREKALVARAIGDMKAIEIELNQYQANNMLPPDDLTAIERDGLLDPWGNPYAYTKIAGASGGKGAFRKDKFLVPLNSDFDLYSMGPDGKSKAPLAAKDSKDDIIRANDGGYMGVAELF
jgi:general secretion pathway protein G